MIFACLWCNKRFVRGPGAHSSVDFFVYENRSNPEIEDEIKRMKFAPPKEKIIDVPREMVVPPVLHAKIKVGNALFDRLASGEMLFNFLNLYFKAAAENQQDFNAVLKKRKLDVNRHDEGVIYSRFHGNDIKRLCQAIGDLKCKFFVFI